MNSQTLSFVIAGGGTGGHLTPGIAIAQEFMARNSKNRILFIGTGKPLEVSILSRTDFAYKHITAEGIKGRGLLLQFASMLKIPRGIFESILILKDFKPDLVIGVGSYAAGPVAMGAWLLGVKLVLHEQNVQPGITNRILAYFAQRIYVSFKSTGERLNSKKILVTGNPVRTEFLNCARDGANNDRGGKRPFRIMITGGSQGAHTINMAVLEAIKDIRCKDAFHFAHQTGSEDEQRVKDAYLCHGISCTVKTFFDDAAMQYKMADLIICRAGATTVAEVTALGKGVIFIPFPFAADNHQVLNARSLRDVGAADMILEDELNGRTLIKKIEYYALKPETLKQMALRAGKFGKPDAAAKIVDDCYRLLCANA